ncbi:hypothetical protein DdX_10869 [Ditylenchus destructor]|uniref:Uncharacterized protein n=1 Tax=Ditylenchus destructor TaxID=166010 RepID=A0AAD4MY36_9BILA|nr:hypothetical protein DdX_10869 [Ditylenchus destructor]
MDIYDFEPSQRREAPKKSLAAKKNVRQSAPKKRNISMPPPPSQSDLIDILARNKPKIRRPSSSERSRPDHVWKRNAILNFIPTKVVTEQHDEYDFIPSQRPQNRADPKKTSPIKCKQNPKKPRARKRNTSMTPPSSQSMDILAIKKAKIRRSNSNERKKMDAFQMCRNQYEKLGLCNFIPMPSKVSSMERDALKRYLQQRKARSRKRTTSMPPPASQSDLAVIAVKRRSKARRTISHERRRRTSTFQKPRIRVWLGPKILKSIFAFFERRNLIRWSASSQRMYNIIQNEFSVTPYLVLNHLSLEQGKWRWNPKEAAEVEPTRKLAVPDKIIALLPLTKFVRFKRIDLNTEDYPTANPLNVIRSVAHIWENSFLNIHSKQQYAPSPALFRMASTCRSMNLFYNRGRRSLFDKGNDVVQMDLPTHDIVNFLFDIDSQHSMSNGRKTLAFHTEAAVLPKEWEAIINNVKEKFLTASAPVKFVFSWNCKCNVKWPFSNQQTINTNTGQCLRLQVTANRFTLITT